MATDVHPAKLLGGLGEEQMFYWFIEQSEPSRIQTSNSFIFHLKPSAEALLNFPHCPAASREQ